MELNDETQEIVQELGAAINAAIEKSSRVAAAIERLREVGFELQLTLKLEIGLRELGVDAQTSEKEIFSETDFRFELTDEDLRTLRRMKIRIDPEE